VISGGRYTTPPSAYADPGITTGGVTLTDQMLMLGRGTSYAAIYRSQPYVSAAVDKVAASAARLSLKTYQRTPDGGRNRLRNHPLALLLARPFPLLDPFQFWVWTVSTFELYGEVIWIKLRATPKGPPIALVPMHPVNVEIELDKETGERVYRWRAIDKTWPQRDVVHFRSYAPDMGLRGRSRLEPLRSTLISEDAVRRASEAWWKNGARPSVVLSHSGNISEPAMARLRASWEHLHRGVDRWGAAAILEEGMTANVMQLTAEDMQMVESRKLARDEICAVFDVPPPVLHILDRATFSNITEQMRSMYRDTMTPRLSLYESVIRSQLIPEFDDPDTVYVEFDMRDVLRGDFEQRTEAYRVAVSTGWMKPKEVRDAENMPDAGPMADQLYVNAALVPMSAVQPGAQPDSGPNDAVLASVAARLSRARTAADIDAGALLRGLPPEIGARVAHRLALAQSTEPIEPLRRDLLAITRGDPE
jgi:HK97 family phage portal protein